MRGGGFRVLEIMNEVSGCKAEKGLASETRGKERGN